MIIRGSGSHLNVGAESETVHVARFRISHEKVQRTGQFSEDGFRVLRVHVNDVIVVQNSQALDVVLGRLFRQQQYLFDLVTEFLGRV